MNNYYYSAAHNAFFQESELWRYEEAGWGLSDLVSVTDEQFREFTTDRAVDGKIRGAGQNGEPVWVDIPPPSAEELIANAESTRAALRVVADSEISWRQDAVDVGIATETEAAELQEWKLYRVRLMRVDTSNPVWPEKPEA